MIVAMSVMMMIVVINKNVLMTDAHWFARARSLI